MLIDTHCHVQFQGYKEDRDDVINRCVERGTIMHLVGTQKDTSKAAVLLAEKIPTAFASIGTHPNHLFPIHIDEEESHFLSREEDFDEAYYETLVQSPKVTAVGECGLDLFHLPADIPQEAVLAKQKVVFSKHVLFAQKHDLPLVIHVREAHEHMIPLLRSFEKRPRATIHCYTSNWSNAQEYLNMGFYLGFTGVVTFPPLKKNPQAQADLLEVVEKMPLDRILLETDAPYMAPGQYRGKRAEPWMAIETAKKIGEIRHISLDTVLESTTQNALTLFNRMKI